MGADASSPRHRVCVLLEPQHGLNDKHERGNGTTAQEQQSIPIGCSERPGLLQLRGDGGAQLGVRLRPVAQPDAADLLRAPACGARQHERSSKGATHGQQKLLTNRPQAGKARGARQRTHLGSSSMPATRPMKRCWRSGSKLRQRAPAWAKLFSLGITTCAAAHTGRGEGRNCISPPPPAATPAGRARGSRPAAPTHLLALARHHLLGHGRLLGVARGVKPARTAYR